MVAKLKSNWKWIAYSVFLLFLAVSSISVNIGYISSILLFQFPSTLILLPILLMSFAVHELAHAVVAHKLGDDSVKSSKHLSLNPLRHCAHVGMALFLFFCFGWAKPAELNTKNLKKPKTDMVLIAVAGPAASFCLALLFLLSILFMKNLNISLPNVVEFFIYSVCIVNMAIGAFNLIPLMPFDGSRMAMAFLPDGAYNFMQKDKVRNAAGIISLILITLLIVSGFFGSILNSLGSLVHQIVDLSRF